MGKRIIQQARGHGGPRYRVRKKTFIYRLGYPILEGKGKVLALINSSVHSCPLAKIYLAEKIFYIPAFSEMVEGQEITLGGNEIKPGNILKLKDIPIGAQIYSIETRPGDGGKLIRTSGNSALVMKKVQGKVSVLMPSKKEVWLDENCRAIIGVIAGAGRLDKPIMKAGKRFYMKRTKGGRVWPRTSAVKMNIVDHPFGSGRGKRIKSKIPKRNAPPGAKVGTLYPRRTGRRKR